ncbi:polyribonucleotide nucleotidyltransferase [Caldimicrobium thiodismutans]|uniref:Polyribonucleotide nucleotidyltransferase n=1 Tax=Caldimicrobium thiodismutans TaxID=1653476 RepID=A0A0U5AKV6_9BACT|nr:polyribonucleotide nucleotidyltransferase [Caldimicrobium thiodismutans]BAU22562.1 polyribonucleotide nucleotidyltransferase [Caldimicrobium thiodismutans]
MERVEIRLDGRDPIIIETGAYARLAGASVVVKQGGTAVLVTACISEKPLEGFDFLPLSVDYREQSSAWGRIPGGFLKREGKPTDREVLVSRLIDRSLRPLFPEGFSHEVVVTALTLSADEKHDPDVLSLLGASAALILSPAPFEGPIGGLRVARSNGKFILNPSYEERQNSDLDLVVAFTEDSLVMVEGGGKEIPEETLLQALFFALEQGKVLILSQKGLAEKLKPQKLTFTSPYADQELYNFVELKTKTKVLSALGIQDKIERHRVLDLIFEEASSEIEESQRVKLAFFYKKLLQRLLRESLFYQGRRIDGRKPEEIRPINIEVHPFERPHGSAIFTRGQTQVFATVTLGSSESAQLVETIFEGETFKRFMLHYNFPPFCTGEARPWGPPRRREIGHGALAERALEPLIPSEEDFPYIIRIVANVLESNGSSSMATVCAGSLALFDAGVPVKKHVAGIAMGLATFEDKYLILTDILGDEDQLGDMDFKVAGTREGITSVQMDIKIKGLKREVLSKALEQARLARLFILDKMYAVLPQPRAELSPFAPCIEIITVPEDKASLIIGPGGKTVKDIRDRTGTTIWVLEGGRVSISGPNREGVESAKREILNLVAEVEIGKIYDGKITRIEPYGLFVEVLPGKIGLLHVSKMDNPPRDLKSVYKIGDKIRVRVIEIDEAGRFKLTTLLGTEDAGPLL